MVNSMEARQKYIFQCFTSLKVEMDGEKIHCRPNISRPGLTDLVSSDNSVRLVSLWLALPSTALGAVGTL